jgi:hypothetical protein
MSTPATQAEATGLAAVAAAVGAPKANPLDELAEKIKADKLVDTLISKLKEMRKERMEEALATASDIVRQLKLVDLYEEPAAMKKAA